MVGVRARRDPDLKCDTSISYNLGCATVCHLCDGLVPRSNSARISTAALTPDLSQKRKSGKAEKRDLVPQWMVSALIGDHRPGERACLIHPGRPLAFGPAYAHEVRNGSLAAAINIHAYFPPLSDINEYEMEGGRLVPRDRESGKAETVDQVRRVQTWKPVNETPALSIEQVLSAARARLRRLSPGDAYKAMVKTGAILVDTRPEGQRAIEGSIPGALVVERNVLEWRFDPASSARLPIATDHDIQVIVICSEGYSSSLAAVALQELGLWRAADVIGGFQAWRAKGLPTVPPARSSS